MMNKKILITGASGFIGSFLVEKALELGMETWAGIRASSSKEYLQDERIKFVDFNFANKEVLKKQISDFVAENGKFHYIVHNAGLTKALKISDFDKVNYAFTVNFVEALKEVDAIPEKFVLMSSLSVMGPGDELHYSPILLSETPKPNTAYGMSKLRGEDFLRSTTDFPYIILRPTGVYGPREKDYFMMVKTILSGLDVSAGMREQQLTFIYVRDLVDATFLALKTPISGKTYFVSDGNSYTNTEYTSLIRSILNKKHVLRIKLPLALVKMVAVASETIAKLQGKPSTLNRDKYKIMKQRNWICETVPLEQELGFRAKYDLKRGLQESIAWYKQQGWI